jgi:hypothetical protein
MDALGPFVIFADGEFRQRIEYLRSSAANCFPGMKPSGTRSAQGDVEHHHDRKAAGTWRRRDRNTDDAVRPPSGLELGSP